MNRFSQGSGFSAVGKSIALLVIAASLSIVLPVARLAHAATDPRGVDRSIGAGMTASANATPPFVTGTFPFGYGGGPSKDVIPPKVKDLLANLRTKLQSLLSGIFGSF